MSNWYLARKHVRAARQFVTNIADALRSGHEASGREQLKVICESAQRASNECSTALEHLDRESQVPTDTEWVRRQLLESVPVRALRTSIAHPFGSSVARESSCDVEIEQPVVSISLETDDLPLSVDGLWSRDEVDVALGFELQRVDRLPPTPHRPVGVQQAVYAVTIQ